MNNSKFKIYHILFIAIFFTLTSFIWGCGTIITLLPEFEVETRARTRGEVWPDCIPRVYSGTVFDIAVVMGPTFNENTEGDFSQGVLLLDLPLSLTLDTVILPFSIYKQVRYGSICQRKKPEINQSLGEGKTK